MYANMSGHAHLLMICTTCVRTREQVSWRQEGGQGTRKVGKGSSSLDEALRSLDFPGVLVKRLHWSSMQHFGLTVTSLSRQISAKINAMSLTDGITMAYRTTLTLESFSNMITKCPSPPCSSIG